MQDMWGELTRKAAKNLKAYRTIFKAVCPIIVLRGDASYFFFLLTIIHCLYCGSVSPQKDIKHDAIL